MTERIWGAQDQRYRHCSMKQPEIAQWWPIGSDNQEELIIWLLATIATRRHPTRRSVTLHDVKQNYHWINSSRLLLPYTDTIPHPISYVAAGNGFTHCGCPSVCLSPKYVHENAIIGNLKLRSLMMTYNKCYVGLLSGYSQTSTPEGIQHDDRWPCMTLNRTTVE